MFEVLCARKVLNQRLQEEQRNLASWAKNALREGLSVKSLIRI